MLGSEAQYPPKFRFTQNGEWEKIPSVFADKVVLPNLQQREHECVEACLKTLQIYSDQMKN